MGTRAEPRFKKRIPCKVKQRQGTFSGIVLDISRTGLFVQTSAAPTAGDVVQVMLTVREPDDPIALRARVVWQKKIPTQLRGVVEGGLGLEIRHAPEPYYFMLAESAQGLAPLSRRPI